MLAQLPLSSIESLKDNAAHKAVIMMAKSIECCVITSQSESQSDRHTTVKFLIERYGVVNWFIVRLPYIVNADVRFEAGQAEVLAYLKEQLKDDLTLVYEQFMKVRDASSVNMLDLNGVMREAYDSDFYDLVTHLANIQHGQEASKKYMEFLQGVR